MAEAEITVMGKKGQVVIPKEVREQLNLKPKTKFLVVGHDDTVLLKKLQLPDLRKEWEELFRIMDKRIAKYGELTEKEIEKEIHASRKERELE
jgi:AbrB family looped-hinge helix DNA binding protein